MKYITKTYFIRTPHQCPERDDIDRYPFGYTTNKCKITGEECDGKETHKIPDWCPLKDVPLKEGEE